MQNIFYSYREKKNCFFRKSIIILLPKKTLKILKNLNLVEPTPHLSLKMDMDVFLSFPPLISK